MFKFLLNRKKTPSAISKISRTDSLDDLIEYETIVPKCGSMICTFIIATLFLAIGIFQTYLAIFHVRAASRNPILVMGPIFIGIGLTLYMVVFQNCLKRHRLLNQISVSKTDLGAQENQETLDASSLENLIQDQNYLRLRNEGLPDYLIISEEEMKSFVLDQRKKKYEESNQANMANESNKSDANTYESQCVKLPPLTDTENPTGSKDDNSPTVDLTETTSSKNDQEEKDNSNDSVKGVATQTQNENQSSDSNAVAVNNQDDGPPTTTSETVQE